jgi:hypothetical protein
MAISAARKLESRSHGEVEQDHVDVIACTSAAASLTALLTSSARRGSARWAASELCTRAVGGRTCLDDDATLVVSLLDPPGVSRKRPVGSQGLDHSANPELSTAPLSQDVEDLRWAGTSRDEGMWRFEVPRWLSHNARSDGRFGASDFALS